MHSTIFNTPVIKSIFRGIALFLLKILGWKTVGKKPDIKKYIIIVAPHTSNWDLFYGIITAFALKLETYFMAKKQLFRWPFGTVIKWLGGTPIDRSTTKNTVESLIEKFNEKDSLVIAIAPDGTRKKSGSWKTGFYYIASGAHIPIVLGFTDYAKKIGGIGGVIMPDGDIDRDMQTIRKFYLTVTGKYADNASTIDVANHDLIN